MTDNNRPIQQMVGDLKAAMGTPEAARAKLIAAARKFRELRKPMFGTKGEIKLNDQSTREAQNQLANDALLWLWHVEDAREDRLAEIDYLIDDVVAEAYVRGVEGRDTKTSPHSAKTLHDAIAAAFDALVKSEPTP